MTYYFVAKVVVFSFGKVEKRLLLLWKNDYTNANLFEYCRGWGERKKKIVWKILFIYVYDAGGKVCLYEYWLYM